MRRGGEKGRVILYFIFRVNYLPCFGGADFPPPAVAVASVSLLCHYPDRFCFIPLFLPAPFLGGRGNPPTPKPGVFVSEPASASKHSSASKDKFFLGISPGPACLKNGCLFKICGFGANSASIPELLYPQESIKPTKTKTKTQGSSLWIFPDAFRVVFEEGVRLFPVGGQNLVCPSCTETSFPGFLGEFSCHRC